MERIIDFNQTVNERKYETDRLWLIKVWNGCGYNLLPFCVWAEDMIDALDTVFDFGFHAVSATETTADGSRGEYYKSYFLTFDEAWRMSDNNQDVFDEQFTCSGTNEDIYVRSENFCIVEVPQEKIDLAD